MADSDSSATEPAPLAVEKVQTRRRTNLPPPPRPHPQLPEPREQEETWDLPVPPRRPSEVGSVASSAPVRPAGSRHRETPAVSVSCRIKQTLSPVLKSREQWAWAP